MPAYERGHILSLGGFSASTDQGQPQCCESLQLLAGSPQELQAGPRVPCESLILPSPLTLQTKPGQTCLCMLVV